ncbi:MAG: HAD-IB family phosphatase [Gemmatimonadaceae bacterium]|nr:HAD-IB family phosphatase [Gemmatimonadaceae bacterium]
MAPRFAAVALDVDSTLSAIEGIDWLAESRGADIAERVALLTNRAMAGTVPISSVYEERLALVAPSRDSLRALGDAYIAAVEPDARATIADLHAAGVRVVLVSGGLRGGIEPLAAHLGVRDADVHAVDIDFHADGRYAGVDPTQPLATADGKAIVLDTLGLPRPLLMVGDGATDAAARRVADSFCAFTGVAERPAVVAAADFVARDFRTLRSLVLAQ